MPLNATGISQAEATARRIEMQWHAAAVSSSPLSRAMKTAEAIAGRFSLGVQIHAASSTSITAIGRACHQTK